MQIEFISAQLISIGSYACKIHISVSIVFLLLLLLLWFNLSCDRLMSGLSIIAHTLMPTPLRSHFHNSFSSYVNLKICILLLDYLIISLYRITYFVITIDLISPVAIFTLTVWLFYSFSKSMLFRSSTLFTISVISSATITIWLIQLPNLYLVLALCTIYATNVYLFHQLVII